MLLNTFPEMDAAVEASGTKLMRSWSNRQM